MITLHFINVHGIDDTTKECDFCLNELEEHNDQFIDNQFSSSYLLHESQLLEIFHTPKETHPYDFIIERINVCVESKHALKGDLLYTLIIHELCMIHNEILRDLSFKNVLMFKHLDLGRPIIKMCIPHTLIDLGRIDIMIKKN